MLKGYDFIPDENKMREKKNVFVIFIILFLLFPLPAPSATAASRNNIAHQLAALHTKYLNPIDVWTARDEDVKPSPATIKEFEWMMDTLKSRCRDQEETIGQIIIETWVQARQKGDNRPLIEIARGLTRIVNNPAISGRDKVNFRLVGQYWLKKNLKASPKI